jgi:putative lipoic acid-binding regulatory protein
MDNEQLLEFPCDFPIKAMGVHSDDFKSLVTDIIGRHTPDLDTTTLRTQDSRHGRYQSVTLTIRARSREQLDAIYEDLTTHERVVIAL